MPKTFDQYQSSQRKYGAVCLGAVLFRGRVDALPGTGKVPGRRHESQDQLSARYCRSIGWRMHSGCIAGCLVNYLMRSFFLDVVCAQLFVITNCCSDKQTILFELAVFCPPAVPGFISREHGRARPAINLLGIKAARHAAHR
jgi:hypothetical protein